MERSANLVPEKVFEENPLPQKFFSWAIGVGRTIIILTNTFVLIVFLSRFSLDTKLADLSEEISVKQAVLKSTGDFEGRARDLQSRLNIISQNQKEKVIYSTAVKKVSDRLPPEITFSDFKITPEAVEITASSPSPSGFGRMVTSMILMEEIKEVLLTSGNYNKSDNMYIFTLSLPVNKEIFNL